MITEKLKNDRRRKTPDRQYQFKICLWIAMGKTTGQIRNLLKDRLNIKTSYQNIDRTYRYGKKWQKIIQYLRIRYLNNIARIPISRKAYRLAILQEAIEEALTWRVKSINRYGKVKEKKVGNIAQLISEARREVEGEKALEAHFHLTVEKKEEKIAKLRRYYSKAEHRADITR